MCDLLCVEYMVSFFLSQSVFCGCSQLIFDGYGKIIFILKKGNVSMDLHIDANLI